jgi:RND family efflux transporter MFP subunit
MKLLVTKWRWWHGALPLLFALAGCGANGEATKPEEEHSSDGEAHVTVRTELARLGTLTESIEGLGRCEALPDHIATLTPAVEGHVHELLVAEGTVVKKGQPIVELDRAVAQADLAEKTASRDGLKASLALLKTIPRAEERRANELAVDQAKLTVAQAKEAVDRLRPLRARRPPEISEQQFFIAENAFEQATIQRKTAEAQLQAMLIGPRPEAVAEAEGKIKTADALVAFSQAHLDYHTIRSPIDGVLDSLHCHPGQTIAIGSPIGEVVDSRQVFASVWLPPRSTQLVRLGQAARILPADTFTPMPDSANPGGEQGLAGTVAFVGRVADAQTGNLPIHVLVDNPQGRLTIGESVRVSIIVDERKAVLQVPAVAVLDLGEGPVLSVVRDGKTAVLHPEAKTSHQGWMEVSGTDLKEGEPVIVDGGYNLPEKTPVKIAEAKTEEKGEAKEDAKGEAKEKPKGEAKEDAKGEAKEKPKDEAKTEPKDEAKTEPKDKAKDDAK